ncbi:MAG: DnaD domain protein [Chloroflexota bacterium]|nr:DnaD domain protein [Dehalococcoidia bacterium]MDW8254655.1 DnaD domain protein [Chloroflexota bacterium]
MSATTGSAPFAGFSRGDRVIPTPVTVFRDLVPAISDLAELKVTLHVIWRLAEKKVFPKFVSRSELETDRTLLASLAASGPPLQELRRALRLAVRRGVLIEVVVGRADGEEPLFFLNSDRDRAIVAQLERGELNIGQTRASRTETPTSAPRPTIYQLYEQNIGLLTPLVAEELQAAEEEYPADWIEDAFRLAATMNRRNWRYIARILERWRVEGKRDGALSADPAPEGWERYFRSDGPVSRRPR